MRKLTVLFLLLISLCASSQYDNSSFYFNIINIDTTQTFSGFEDYEIGFYDWKDVDYKQMIVTEDSISVRFGSEIMLSKNAAQAKGYTFKDGKMYGIAPLNGVYYKEVKDTIFALYYQYDSYFSCKSDDLLIPIDSGYLLFINESNGFYTLEYMTIKDKVLSIYSMDHTLSMDTLLKIKSIYQEEKNGSTTFVASPNIKELINMVNINCFDQKREFQLNKKL